ncbi:FMN-dependent NADH-azoreductase [Hymenobacter sp. DG25B]|uniref:SDR family oxidoreductase n=1 Tax=Hymenobacter sp. DG25B TaxID=1385664 RepID=UPI0005412A34|nr:SDR family oxidoreductase [Hymenobacter sp. DG25B]AIZ64627.1 FMN-dependent NADH-azoreductase [Hymenobacter sp. DG25B]
MSHTILVTGATGTVGSEVVKALSNCGVTVRAGVHSLIKGDRLKTLNPAVQLVEMDFADPQTLVVALTGVDKVVLITPFDEHQVEETKQLVDAARQAGVRYILRLSVLGAEQEPGILLGRWHRAAEQYIEQSGLAYTLLRPNSFMQNFLVYYGDAIREEGRIYLPLGEGKISYVDVRDIASVAATILTAQDEQQHYGKSYTLTGPQALSVAEAAQAISQATGRPVQYVDVPEAAARQGMQEAQMPAWMVDGMLELHSIGKAGYAAAVTSTVQDLTGRAPHTFQQFAQDFHPQFSPAS